VAVDDGGGLRTDAGGRAAAAVVLLRGMRVAAEVSRRWVGGGGRRAVVGIRRWRTLGLSDPRIIDTLPVAVVSRWAGGRDGGDMLRGVCDDDGQKCGCGGDGGQAGERLRRMLWSAAVG
jgi:hypothetical protein